MFLTLLLLPEINFTPDFLHIQPLSGTGRWGMEVAVSSSHVVSATPSSSGVGRLTLFPCSSSHGIQSFTNFSNLSPSLHELLQHELLAWDAVLQDQTNPPWIPLRVTSSASKPALMGGLSLSPQVL